MRAALEKFRASTTQGTSASALPAAKQAIPSGADPGQLRFTDGQRESLLEALQSLRAARLVPVPKRPPADQALPTPEPATDESVTVRPALRAVADEPVMVRSECHDQVPGEWKEFSLPKPPVRREPEWFGPGEQVKVAGYVLPGFVRVVWDEPVNTESLRPGDICAWMTVVADKTGYRPPAWDFPKYAFLTDEQRGGYLEWLARGRPANKAPWMAMMFVAGLEARVADVGANSLAPAERTEIVAALTSLKVAYGDSMYQLEHRTIELAEFLEWCSPPEQTYKLPAPPTKRSTIVPAPVQVAAGQAARDKARLPADWTLALVVADIDFPVRTSVTRCHAELAELLALRLEALDGGSFMPLGPRPGPLVLRYTTMLGSWSSLFPPFLLATVESADTVTMTSKQRQRLNDVVLNCAEELSSYSRFLGRNPELQGTADAILRLPSQLLQHRLREPLCRLHEAVRHRGPVTVDEACTALFGSTPVRKDSEKMARQLLAEAGLPLRAGARLRPAAPELSKRPGHAAPEFSLDLERVEAIRTEDARTAALLGQIFAEDSASIAAPWAEAHTHQSFPHLDAGHLELLELLVASDRITRPQVNEAARKHELMLDGALELINEGVLDLTGETLVSDDGAELHVDAAISAKVREALASP